MKGTSISNTIGAATLIGLALAIGTGAGSSSASSWFPQIGQLVGTSSGTSVVAQVTREVVEIPSTITLISEYASSI